MDTMDTMDTMDGMDAFSIQHSAFSISSSGASFIIHHFPTNFPTNLT